MISFNVLLIFLVVVIVIEAIVILILSCAYKEKLGELGNYKRDSLNYRNASECNIINLRESRETVRILKELNEEILGKQKMAVTYLAGHVDADKDEK